MVFTGDTLFVGGVGRTDLGMDHCSNLYRPYEINYLYSPMTPSWLPAITMAIRQKAIIERRRFTILMLAKELFISKFFALAIVISVLFFPPDRNYRADTRKGDSKIAPCT